MMTELEWWRSLDGEAIDENTDGVPPYDVERVARIVASKLRPGVVLDLGCGTGRLTEVVQRLAPLCTYVAVDVAPRMLDRARQRLSCRGVDVVSLPYLPDRLDAAYAVTVFQHLPHEDVCAYIRKIGLRLMKGGVFVFQYVEGDADSFCSHQFCELEIRVWCEHAELNVVSIENDEVYREWRWVTAVKP